MSQTIVVILLLLIFALALAPIALAFRRPTIVAPVCWTYGVAILGILIYQTGLLPQPLPVTLRADVLDSGHPSSGRCAEILDMLEQQHVIMHRTDPARLIVNQDLWGQLPQEAKDAIVQCAEAARPASGRGDSLEVVEQPIR